MTKTKTRAALTARHLLQLKTALQNIRPEIADMWKGYRELPKKGREMLFGAHVWWAWCYELTMIQHGAVFFHALGQLDLLRTVLDKATDKNQAMLDFMNSYEPDDKTMRRLFGPRISKANRARKTVWAAALIGLFYQVECLEKEGCYMSDLVERVRKGDEEAFFKALHIDRTVVSCPTFGAMISRAALEDKKLFFENFGRAIAKPWNKASPQKKAEHKDLRVMLQATHESGQLKKMSMNKADELFIKELTVYSDEGDDPARSLQRFIHRFKSSK